MEVGLKIFFDRFLRHFFKSYRIRRGFPYLTNFAGFSLIPNVDLK